MHFVSVVLICMGFVALGKFEKILENGMTCREKKIVLDEHNEYRMMIANGSVKGQPKSYDMQRMVWDDALTEMAQKWADKMIWQHNPDRKDNRFSVGENMYKIYGKELQNDRRWKAPLKAWFDEHNLYTYRPLNSNDIGVGHYTQVVWSTTNRVGCGFVFYIDNENTYHKMYVCNYGPAGNYVGRYPYRTIEGCDKLCCTGDHCKKPYGDHC